MKNIIKIIIQSMLAASGLMLSMYLGYQLPDALPNTPIFFIAAISIFQGAAIGLATASIIIFIDEIADE